MNKNINELLKEAQSMKAQALQKYGKPVRRTPGLKATDKVNKVNGSCLNKGIDVAI